MTVIGEAFVQVRALTDPAGFERDLQRQIVPAGKRVATTLATAIGGAFVATKLKGFAQEGIAELEAAAAAQAQTAAAIKSTGGVANVTAEDIEKLAGAQLKLTGVDDELIQSGANKLLTFTRVRNEVGKGNDVFNQATIAALDLSRAGFGSVESASVLLGKALNDPVQGLTALQRVGVRLSDDQKELVRQLVATGDTLGAQKVILQEVNTQVGGSAEAYGKTLPGQLAIARESLDNTKGQLLAGMAPALQLTAGLTSALTEKFAEQPEVLQQIEGGLFLVVGGLASIITPLKSGIDLWRSFGNGAQAAGALADISRPVGNSAAAVDGLYTKTGRLQGRLRTGALALGTLGAAFVAASLVANAFARDIDHVDVNVLTQDLLNLADGSAGVAQLGVDVDTLGRAVERIAAPSNVSRLNHVGGALFSFVGDEAASKVNTSKASIDDLDKALANLAGQNPEAAAKALAAVQAELSPENAERLLPLLDDYESTLAGIDVSGRLAADATEDVAGATDEFGAATADTSGELTEYEKKLKGAREAVDNLFTATESAIDAEFRYGDAKDSTADALANLTQLHKDGKGATDEFRRAQDDTVETMFRQAQAAADLAAQNYELAGVTLDAADKASIQKAELERLRDTLAPNSPLRARLQGMIDQLAAVPVSKTVTVNVLTGQALVDLDRLAQRINDFAGGNIRISVGGGGGLTLAGGGRVPAYLASGGGPRGTDTVPAWLTPGEYVNTAATVDRLGVAFFDALNRGANPSRAGDAGSPPVQLHVHGATVEGAYAVAAEAVRQLRAEQYRQTGVVV